MKTIKFTKMHGAGNDFIMIDDRDGSFPDYDYRRIAAMGTRRSGVGCEGIILVQASDKADFKMRFFNPDGTEAEMCGNGARCVAAFARGIGAAAEDKMTFETIAGLVTAELLAGNLVRVGMPNPTGFAEDFVVAGVPHKIVAVENVSKADVEREGRKIRMSGEFAPGGTNVDFVQYKHPNKALVRTYERGVEAETGACGTGAVASAVIGVRDYGLEFPVTVKTSKGYELIVDGEDNGGEIANVTLTGPYKKVFEGELDWDELDADGE